MVDTLTVARTVNTIAYRLDQFEVEGAFSAEGASEILCVLCGIAEAIDVHAGWLGESEAVSCRQSINCGLEIENQYSAVEDLAPRCHR